jgi:hypothetical protein
MGSFTAKGGLEKVHLGEAGPQQTMPDNQVPGDDSSVKQRLQLL